MPQILLPTTPVRFCIARLRQSVAESSRFSDDDLLGIINDGYRQACRRAENLETLVTLTITAGSVETALPDDWVVTKRVYQSGVPLDPVDYRRIADDAAGTYYQYARVIGVPATTADSDTTLLLLYAREPDTLDYDDTPEWGAEWNYLLRHYAAWRCILASGGEQTIRKAVQQRTQFENAVRKLRQSTRKGKRGGQQRARTTMEGPAAVAG